MESQREDGLSTDQSTVRLREKKVRIACQRCRDRRIKCDGLVPACGKCAKAGVACVDVDAHRGEGSIPRSFQADASARLAWLETLVKERLPDIDLSTGPSRLVDVDHGARANDLHSVTSTPAPDAQRHAVDAQSDRPNKRARSADGEPDNEVSMRKRARRMALDLGLLSLDINASQVRYLGSSSGSMFASLLQSKHNGTSLEVDAHARDGAAESGLNSAHESEDEDQAALPPLSANVFAVLKESLPPRKQCNALVKDFFAQYHADYPLFHRPSFDSIVDALYACVSEPDAQNIVRQHNGWPARLTPFRCNDETARIHGKDVIALPIKTAAAQLFLVFSIAAHLQTRRRSYSTDPKKFHRQGIHLAPSALSDVSLGSLQVMLLLVLQSFITPQPGNTWILLHAAMASAIDLGLHREVVVSARFSALAVQMRRRIFFCTYTLDRLVSTAQGRPIGFQDDTLDLSMPSVVPSYLHGSSHAHGFDQELLSWSAAHFQWSVIISQIKYNLYRFRLTLSPSETAALQQDLSGRLEEWLTESTATVETLTSNHRLRFETKLKIDYHFAISLLYQPSLVCISPDGSALQRCFHSATQRIRLYGSLHDQNHLYMSWPTTHGIFLAGATLIYCIWMSTDVRSKASVSELAKDFRLCSNLLTLGGEWWPLAQRGRRSFERLVDTTLDSLSNKVRSQQPTNTASGAVHDAPSVSSMDFYSPSTNMEGILQTFLQNELPLADVLDTFDASGFGQELFDWNAGGTFDFGLDYAQRNPDPMISGL